jgi:hypothetical protein
MKSIILGPHQGKISPAEGFFFGWWKSRSIGEGPYMIVDLQGQIERIAHILAPS